MLAIKKINNNVALCRDNDERELIAFGKGIGFPTMPYEITDLSQVTMTFYKLNSQYLQLLTELPEDVVAVSLQIVQQARSLITRPLNPNIVFSLADHINFAIIRSQKHQTASLLYSYDIAQFYPQETAVGEYAIKVIEQQLHVKLPPAEITAIATHFLNSQEVTSDGTIQQEQKVIEQALDLVERNFNIKINRQSFTYNRFVVHLNYYLRRLQQSQQMASSQTAGLYQTFQKQFPKIYQCACEISTVIDQTYQTVSSQSEKFYLMLYIQRMVDNTQAKE